ncbi:RNA-binding RNA processing protein rpp1 [Coemansia sp. RSA 1822]|nr:RNA-binding RNA processing protein rpp1 [Coemansia sp. RSA 638]KAJ2124063.1 RNA-binding RNA processing protein rpp1 [Coemansia sp. RSA 720]KAJ2540989.1 RNA-binding RNA processing protein rpp1 [Coemansia sp. RSA 1853]KAJ2561207.1 RNA-binding RNA processing protein rpp1 [Coemansia sp. RSA 1822]
MFYDLNIPLPEAAGKAGGHVSSQEWAQIAQTVEQARELGYSVVALNLTVQGKLAPEHLSVWNTTPEFKNAQLSWDRATGARVGGATRSVGRGKIRVLRRLTAVIGDAAQGHSLASVDGAYDIVAVQPTNDAMLLAACNGTWDAVDIVALDMGQRWNFVAKQKVVTQALALGVSLEIMYQPALAGEKTRQQWVSNAAAVVRATRGRSVIWTSAARRALDLRAPYDVANLGEVLQLNGDLSKRALAANARAALMHAFTRSSTLRAVIAPKHSAAGELEGLAKKTRMVS